jgi:hypothetical protein
VPVKEGEFAGAGEAGVEPRALGGAGAVESSTYVWGVEQAEVFPALSVAVARKLVDESFATETVKPGDANVAAEPVATGAAEQSEVVYRRTVEPAAALPVISGSLSFAGDPGEESRALGAAGDVESSTYATGAEQEDTFPAPSSAVARKDVVLSSATATGSPGDANWAVVPVATGAPEQSADV